MLLKSLRRLLLGIVLALAPLWAEAQPGHPNRSLGAAPMNLYAASGEDQVSLFNGNLSFRIPIGEGVQVGPGLRLSADLVYNSKLVTPWAVRRASPQQPLNCPDEYAVENHWAGDRYAGLGWQVHFGRLTQYGSRRIELCQAASQTEGLPPEPPPIGMNARGSYLAPDGSTHVFYDRFAEAPPTPQPPPAVPDCITDRGPGPNCFWYTHDGTFMRLDPRDPGYGDRPTLYAADGTIVVFGHSEGREITGSTDDELDFNWNGFAHATQIRDRFNNSITIQYLGQAGTGTTHPLADIGVPQKFREALPYRAFPTNEPDFRYEFSYDVVTANLSPNRRAPRLRTITCISSEAAPYSTATYFLMYAEGASAGMPAYPNPQLLTQVSFAYPPLGVPPSAPHPASRNYLFAYQGSALPSTEPLVHDLMLSRADLPGGGRYEYSYASWDFWFREFEYCPFPNIQCYGLNRSTSAGIRTRTAVRLVNGADEPATTTYVQSIDPACSGAAFANCKSRTDVWPPRGQAAKVAVSSTVFHASDGIANQGLYGRPEKTREFWRDPVAGTIQRSDTPDADAHQDLFKLTKHFYHWDREADTPALGGFDHNTREWKTEVTSDFPDRAQQVERLGWDGYGHFAEERTKEFDGADPNPEETDHFKILRSIVTTFSSSTPSFADAWILNAVTSRTVSSPEQQRRRPGTNSSTTATFSVNADGYTSGRSMTDGATGRIHTTTWTRNDLDPSCLDEKCSHRGLPVSETVAVTNGGSYTRNYKYQFRVPALAWDTGTTFYVLDADLSPTGKVIRSRAPNGRSSLTGPVLLESFLEYDRFGRLVRETPPGETTRFYTYFSGSGGESVVRSAGATAGVDRVFSDGLGRPVVHLRQMVTDWAYRVTTYDLAGRAVAESNWTTIACADVSNPCPTLADKQDVLSGTLGNPTSGMPGTIWSDFSKYGPAQITKQADGAITGDTWTAWFSRTTTRQFNATNSTSSTTTYFDALGRPTFVVQPPTLKSDGSPMNPTESAENIYDHSDRLISWSMVGYDHNQSGPIGQTRTWQYDDFGGLVQESTPEVPLVVVENRDARGNPLQIRWGNSGDGYQRIRKGYDAAGRLLWSERDGDPDHVDNNHRYEEFCYDTAGSFGPSFQTGYSNGSLVYGKRWNLVQLPGTDLGWYLVSDLTYYNGVGGRPSLRQMSMILADGSPLPSVVGANPTPGAETGLQASGRKVSDAVKKKTEREAFEEYFKSQGRSKKKAADDLEQVLGVEPARKQGTAVFPPIPKLTPEDYKDEEPIRSVSGGISAGSEPLGDGGVANQVGASATPLSATQPNGWYRWLYSYDNLGRLSYMEYPRRDEGAPTQVWNNYVNGWHVHRTISFNDPFAGSNPVAQLTLVNLPNPSGTTFWSYAHRLENGVYTTVPVMVRAPDDQGMPRPLRWRIRKQSDTVDEEVRQITYDKSGSFLTIGASQYVYDARGRLTSEPSYTRAYDGFGNITLTNGFVTPVDRATNRLSLAGTTYDVRGNLLIHSARVTGRAYYPDDRQIGDYRSDELPPSRPLTANLLDSARERALFWYGGAGVCEKQDFREVLRGLGSETLTDYRGVSLNACSCEVPCNRAAQFEKDSVRFGNVLATYKRGEGVRVNALDHLGSPRIVFNLTDVEPIVKFYTDAFGNNEIQNPTPVPPALPIFTERSRFTGQEREHTTAEEGGPGSGASPLPLADYMHARIYIPQEGRFASPDALGGSPFLPQTWNRYSYVTNMPLMYVDPFGMSSEPAADVEESNAEMNCRLANVTCVGVKESVVVTAENPYFSDSLAWGLVFGADRLALAYVHPYLVLTQPGSEGKGAALAEIAFINGAGPLVGGVVRKAGTVIGAGLESEGLLVRGLTRSVFGEASLGAAQARVLQTGERTLRKATATALNEANGMQLSPREWGRGLEALKKAGDLANNHHGKIWSTGLYTEMDGTYLGNILDFIH